MSDLSVNTSAQQIVVEVADGYMEVRSSSPIVEISPAEPDTFELLGGYPTRGPVELYDSNTPPADPVYPYLRFERDVDGDVQAIYLGTAS